MNGTIHAKSLMRKCVCFVNPPSDTLTPSVFGRFPGRAIRTVRADELKRAGAADK